MERFEAVELAPFKSAIKAGADSVMIAHLYLPYLMQGDMLPSTVSYTVVTELLRKKLDFDGLIISDCMEMQALIDTVGTEQGVVKALQAGIDLVLVSHCHAQQRGSIKAIQAAVEDSTLPADKICQAAECVLQLKARFLYACNQNSACYSSSCVPRPPQQQ